MLENGNYSAWFRTQQGEATGIVVLNDGRVTGGDNVSSYSGHISWTEVNSRLPFPRGVIRRDRLPFSASIMSI